MLNKYFPATFTEGGAANTLVSNDAKMNLLESGGLPQQTTATTTQSTLGPPSLSVGNHLDIPQNNPNLLSPDMLNQRRGSFSFIHCHGRDINYINNCFISQEAVDRQFCQFLICLHRLHLVYQAMRCSMVKIMMKVRMNWMTLGDHHLRRLRK